MKFIADRMLGSFAKWLRVFGLDVYYDAGIGRASMIRIAKEEDRVILTRARNFRELKHIPQYLIINDEHLEPQLTQFFSEFNDVNIRDNVFARCVECNESLEPISKEEVADKVPPKAYEMHDKYMTCPNCRRVYWEGTHVTRMEKFIQKF